MKKLSLLLSAFVIVTMNLMFFSCKSISHQTTSRTGTVSKVPQLEAYDNLFEEAGRYFSQRRWRKAEKTYKKAAECKATFAVNYNVGVSAYNRGKYKEAIKYFSKSLKYNHSQEDANDTKNMIEKSRKQLQRRKEIIAASVGAALVGVATVAASASGVVSIPNNDPQYQAWINYRNSGLPGASTISFDDFKRANTRAAANGYQVSNHSSSSNTSSSNASSNSTQSNSKKCGFCGGRGWNVEYTVGFGLAKQEHCSTCGKTMMSNHYHATCQKCKGTGIEQ